MKLLRPIALALSLSLCALHAENSADVAALKSLSNGFREVAKKATPAVVFLEVQVAGASEEMGSAGATPFEDDALENFFGHSFKRGKPSYQTQSQGSGFFVSSDGYILTNNHVVANASKIIVRTTLNRDYVASVIGTDKSSDMALLKIEGKNFPYLEFAKPDTLEVGEWAIAIGSPFALSNTFTVGVVSAKGRSTLRIADYEDFVQTDAAINPGNSGGPLINLDGKIIGINTAIASKSGGYNGIGFAIPVNLATFVMNQLKTNGKVSRGFLGVGLREIDAEMASKFKLQMVEGALISEVETGSPAATAGLKLGDIILEFNDKPVTDYGKLRNEISMTPPGQSVAIKVLRADGATITLNPILGSAAGHASSAAGMVKKLGFTVKDISKAFRSKIEAQIGESAGSLQGCYVSSLLVGTHAQHRGVHVGMVIDEVNRTPVTNAAEFNKAVAAYLEDVKLSAGKKKPALLLRAVSIKSGKALSSYITIPTP